MPKMRYQAMIFSAVTLFASCKKEHDTILNY